jgi:hypothetical protein
MCDTTFIEVALPIRFNPHYAAKALTQLEALPGDQPVIARYNQYHNSRNKWVYHRADIDTAKIVWAHDMGDSGNTELIRYFPQRRVWVAEPDLARPRLSSYPVPADQRTLSQGTP